MQQERALAGMGERAIGTFLGERARREAAEAARTREVQRIREAEAAALAKIEAAETKVEREKAAKELEFERKKELRGIPTAKTPEDLERIEAQTELARKRIAKIDVELEGKEPAALTPSQRLALDKELKKSEELVIDNMNEPSSKPDMEFINKRGDNPYYYTQIEEPGKLWGVNLVGKKIPLPRGLTMSQIRASAVKNNVDVETILRALPELREYFQE